MKYNTDNVPSNKPNSSAVRCGIIILFLHQERNVPPAELRKEKSHATSVRLPECVHSYPGGHNDPLFEKLSYSAL